jgi:2-oxoisovalerate dehydrogenase E1 component alpha subunit
LEKKDLWSDEKEAEARGRLRKECLKAFAQAEKEKKPPLRTMFEDVYEEMTPEIKAQMKQLKEVIDRYPDEYDVSEFEGGKDTLSS